MIGLVHIISDPQRQTEQGETVRVQPGRDPGKHLNLRQSEQILSIINY